MLGRHSVLRRKRRRQLGEGKYQITNNAPTQHKHKSFIYLFVQNALFKNFLDFDNLYSR